MLLLQKNTVQLSIINSYENAPDILQIELSGLVETIQNNPNDIKSYLSFYEVFKNEEDLSVIQETMKSFYSISINGIENSDVQLSNIMRSIYRQREIADKMKNEEIMLDLENIFKLPILVTLPKLFFDLYMILTVILPAMTKWM